jgi:bifunctional oligoribonuclease and PAP phosphatase NrnA
MTYPDSRKLVELVADAQSIVVLQADNPDADSLGSALALETILGDLGKQVSLYSAVDMPGYLRYMPGWDRVDKELPTKFDMSIIVDASTTTLFEAFENPQVKIPLAAKPCVILDHHEITDHPVPFATVTINDGTRASAGELIYIIARDLGWGVSKSAGEYITSSILGDTQGLSNELAGPHTYRIMAELLELGVNRPELEELRREYGKMPEVIFRYKAKLIDRTELYEDGALAIVVIPQDEINTYSPLYNPAPLIQNDILQTKGVKLAIILKQYDTGRITAAIRANSGSAVAGQLAEHFGGGGHKYAAGFKITDGRPFNEVKSECIAYATELLQTTTE